MQNAPLYINGANQASALNATNIIGVPGYDDASHNALFALIRWVENGTAPDELVATKFVDDNRGEGVLMQRPLCVFPKEAKYVSGDSNEAASFECVEI